MINPSDIVNALVAALQGIPQLVDQLGGKATNIYAYRDSPPQQSSLSRAIYEMISPSVMVVWIGTSPSRKEGIGLFSHEVSLYVRADDATTAPGTPTFANVITAMINGTPTGRPVRFIMDELMPNLQPMEVPTIRRIHDEEGTLDLFEVATEFTELWEDLGTVS